MYRGTNVIYADFTDYDELAHHCGPERVESFEALDGVDRAIATLSKAAEDAPRPYRFIVLSDHGQSLGATFKQRYGHSLGEVIRDLMGGRATRRPVEDRRPRARRSSTRSCPRSPSSKGVGPTRRPRGPGQQDDATASSTSTTDGDPAAGRRSAIVVVGSGNLGLVWFTGTRPSPHGRGARRAASRAGGPARRAPRRRARCWSARRSSARWP